MGTHARGGGTKHPITLLAKHTAAAPLPPAGHRRTVPGFRCLRVKLAQPPPQRFTCCCNDSSAEDRLLPCNYDGLRPSADTISAGAAAEAAVFDLFVLRAAPQPSLLTS